MITIPKDNRKETFLLFLSQKSDSVAKIHRPYSYPMQKAISCMKRNLDRRLSLSELAKVATMHNTSYFGYRFRQDVGLTPAAHHLQLRLEAARDSLSQPSMDIT